VWIGWPRGAKARDGDGGSSRAEENGVRNEEDGDSVLLEVSLPRQPCFKLNTRFGIKNFAKRTHELNCTGWYYRVLREGWIEAGMEIRVLERKYPQWTIEMLLHHVHRNLTDRARQRSWLDLRG
jgi:MOSC domain-containing protein YiiM